MVIEIIYIYTKLYDPQKYVISIFINRNYKQNYKQHYLY